MLCGLAEDKAAVHGAPTLVGVDFTSAPRRAKPITAAIGCLDGKTVELTRIETLSDWPAFEALLARPGPWFSAFDFPFGLPRQAIVDLGWPLNWPELVRHCEALERSAFRSALDAYRQTRPFGRALRTPQHRLAARSRNPLRVVNHRGNDVPARCAAPAERGREPARHACCRTHSASQ